MADERTEKQKVQEITDKLAEGLKERKRLILGYTPTIIRIPLPGIRNTSILFHFILAKLLDRFIPRSQFCQFLI